MSSQTTMEFDAAAREVAEATPKQPLLCEMGPEAGRKLLEELESAPIGMLSVDER